MSFINADFAQAAKHLARGGILTFPTETVYGVGCAFDDEAAFHKLVELKKRPPNKPFSMMVSSLDMALPYLDPSPRCLAFMTHVFPGEITVLLKGTSTLPWHVTLGTGVIGLRIPKSSDIKRLFETLGKPCLVTSANISGEPTARSLADLDPVFVERTMVIEGTCESQVPSTIVDATGEELRLVRAGLLSFADLLSLWRSL